MTIMTREFTSSPKKKENSNKAIPDPPPNSVSQLTLDNK